MNPEKEIKTPELDKMLLVKDDSQKIGDFLEWLRENGIILSAYVKGKIEDRLAPINKTTEELLADYFKIDLKKCEKERRKILNGIRAKEKIKEATLKQR